MIDYHLHLWRHGRQPSLQASVDQLADYCEAAARQGVTEMAVTEHLFRFAQADAVLNGWWRDDPEPLRQTAAAAYWDEHLGADLDQYVDTVLAAKAAGLPIVLGLEVDYYADRMDVVGELLAAYPFDVLLGSVHWIGAWLFDVLESAAAQAEWSNRGVGDAWDAYTVAIEELAASGAVDVLAHPDLAKVAGHRPSVPAEFHDRIAEAAAASGLAAEVSSAGWRKPCAEQYPAVDLLERFKALGVPVTTASDGHALEEVSWRVPDLRGVLAASGYTELAAYRARQRVAVPIA